MSPSATTMAIGRPRELYETCFATIQTPVDRVVRSLT